MDAVTPSSSPKARRWPRLQFSLRLLLIAFTAFAIGIPIWYRWPFEEVELMYPMVRGQPDKTKPPVFKTVTTWRRTWGGGKLMHGRRSRGSPDGKFETVDYYVNHAQHGPHVEYRNGFATVTGQYARGNKSGEWIHQSSDGVIESRTNWVQGKLDGRAEQRQADGALLILKFEAGDLVEINGAPPSKSWKRMCAGVEADSRKLAKSLRETTRMEFVQTPLKDSLQILIDTHGIPTGVFQIDRFNTDVDHPVTFQVSEIDLGSALAALTQSHGMDCDYRYGRIWITSAEDAENWIDPTGLSELDPGSGTALSDVWNKPVSATTFPPSAPLGAIPSLPLADVVQSLAKQLALDIDTTQVEPSEQHPDGFPIVLYSEEGPLCETLGILLYSTRCRCRLDDEHLVILPPDSSGIPE